MMKKYWGLIIVLILSWWAIFPLTRPGFFPIHDDTQVARVFEMAKALKEGQFPVRWVADLGYGFGYPIFNFYSPLPYYIGGLFNLLGFDALLATKLMFILGILASGVFIYLLAREFFEEQGGILAGLFYVYAPYHALDIYVRGAVGEFWALSFLPLAVWGFYKVAVEPKWQWVMVGSMGYAGLVLSHNITALIFTPILVMMMILYWLITKNTLYFILYTFSFGLSLSAFFWLPAIFEASYTNVTSQIGGGADFRDHFVYWDQLWASPWGFGGSTKGRLDGMSFMIGKLHIILTALSLFMAIWFWLKGKRKMVRWLYGWMAIWLFAVFMTTPYSKFIWEAIPAMAYIQYPWRFLVLVIFVSSFLAGSLFLWFKSKSLLIRFLFFGFLLIGLLYFNTKYFKPQMYLPFSIQDFTKEETIKWKTSKISDEYLPAGFPLPQIKEEIVAEKIIFISGNPTLSDLKIKSHWYSFTLSGEGESQILIRTAYFPGWRIFIDKKKVDAKIKEGQMLVAIPAGKHEIKVVFKNTPVRNLGNFISLLSFIILLGGVTYGRKKMAS